jgi:predicted transposase YdaD
LEDKTSYDKIAIGTIYLGKNHKVEERYEEMDELMTPLTILFTNNINDAKEKIRILDDEYGIKLSEESKGEVKDMCNLSEGIEMDALDRGIVIGEKRGKIEGILEGKREGKIEAIIELVKDGDLTIEKAIRKLGITKDDFELLMSE